MIKFYSVLFTNKLGHEDEQIVIGTEQQVNDWAIKEASIYGFTYDVRYMCSDKFTYRCPDGLDNIKNLCNY